MIRSARTLAACVGLVAGGVGGLGLLAAGALDVVFAGFFAGVLWLPRPRPPA